MSGDENLQRLAASLNQHGYGFQGAVLRHLRKLVDEGKSEWVLEATEFPVEVQGQGTRIDIILRTARRRNLWQIVECKRVNPAYHDWLFARSPHVARNWEERNVVEGISKAQASSFVSGGMSFGFVDKPYHIALSVRATEKAKGDRDQIEEAATQVMRGVNGLVLFLSRNAAVFEQATTVVFFPVIFTTAKLWVTENALMEADLMTGNVDPTKCAANEVEWLYYQYPTSPGIKHDLPSRTQNSELSVILQHEYIRTIAVVNVAGIANFLGRRHPDNLIVREIGQ